MKKILFLVMFLMCGCSFTTASESIAKNTIKEVVEVKKIITQIKDKTPIECKSDLFLSQLQSIDIQADSIRTQVENISLACQTEKDVLKKDIRIRELVIISFFAIFIFILIVRLRR